MLIYIVIHSSCIMDGDWIDTEEVEAAAAADAAGIASDSRSAAAAAAVDWDGAADNRELPGARGRPEEKENLHSTRSHRVKSAADRNMHKIL